MNKDKIIDFFNSKANIWDEICYHNPGKLSEIIKLCKIKEGDRVIDVACGTGILIPLLLDTPAGEIIGIDIAPAMIDAASEKYQNKRLKFIAADIYDFEDTKFNTAIIYSAYPHFFNKEDFIDRISRLLIPGGRFIIAHSEGAEAINCMHKRKASEISLPLEKAEVEACLFNKLFTIDTLVDTEDLYIISGLRR